MTAAPPHHFQARETFRRGHRRPLNLQGSICNCSRRLDCPLSTRLAIRALSCCEMPLLTSSQEELVLLSVPCPLNTWWWCIQGAAGSSSWYYALLLILWDGLEFWAEVDRKCLRCWTQGGLGSAGGVEEEVLIFACHKTRTSYT